MTSFTTIRALAILAALVRILPASCADTTLSLETPDGRVRTAVGHEPTEWVGT